MKADSQEAGLRGSGLFPETVWTLLLEPIRQRAPDAQAALEELCERYRRPLVALAYCKVRNQQDAEDITHEFLLSLLRREDFTKLDRSKGRFRAFLRASLTYFIINWRRRDRRGLQTPIEDVNEECLAEDEQLTQQFNAEWALAVVQHGLAHVEEWYARKGKAGWHALFVRLLPGAENPISQTDAAMQLGITPNQLRVEYHRFRDRLEEAIRKEISLTVAGPDDVPGELEALKRHLSGVAS